MLLPTGVPEAAGVRPAATEVLLANDRGARTVAAPQLYPHQWSWDAAFVSIGWAAISVPRALSELRSLLVGQWRTGMIPHIVFSDAPGYFPGPDRWRTDLANDAPATPPTSGICQPPVHGLAVHVIGEFARRRGGADAAAFEEFLAETLDDWLAWHRWLARVRGDQASGLVCIHHGWESGMDNSPRWDLPYARIQVGELKPYRRRDLEHVDDPAERPSDADYDRYVHLVDQLAGVHYRDDLAARVVDFRVGDVFITALHALSAELLAGEADRLGRNEAADELRLLAGAAREAVTAAVEPETGLARDYDTKTGQWLDSATIGGFAPLLCGGDERLMTRQARLLAGPDWCGHPELAVPVVPSTSPRSAAFVPTSYWRGPCWPVITWLFSWCLAHHGFADQATKLSRAGLGQLSRELDFAEYYAPFDGRALGSRRQSWTAAVALAWAAGIPEMP